MRNIMLDWQQAAWVTAGLAALAVLCMLLPGRGPRLIAPFAREAAMIAGLYSLWQFAGRLSGLSNRDAFVRARWVERVEHDLHLPAERTLNAFVTGHSLLAHVADLYYDTMHFTIMFVFLIWLFTWHRDRYVEIRRVLAVTTLLCLLIQLVPVAPPRLLPGFTDTALRYGQSVYGDGFDTAQLSAMPSVHVAWAVLIGWSVWRVGRGPWRWIGPAHAVLTVLVVVATANHFWADGIVAVAVLVVSAALVRALERAAAALGSRIPRGTSAPPRLSERPAGVILR